MHFNLLKILKNWLNRINKNPELFGVPLTGTPFFCRQNSNANVTGKIKKFFVIQVSKSLVKGLQFTCKRNKIKEGVTR
jgi:hypothetical protein